MDHLNVNSSLGTIVAAIPQAARLFQALRIDYCCGGDRSLTDAARDLDLEPAAVWQQVRNAAAQTSAEPDLTALSPAELINEIENRHHHWLHGNLPLIGELVFKILQVHGERHPELYELHNLYSRLRLDLEQHLVKEETRLFPGRLDKPALSRLIAELRREHEAAGGALRRMRSLTGDYAVPDDGCPTYRQTYNRLEALESDLFRHIHLENNLLFPRLTA